MDSLNISILLSNTRDQIGNKAVLYRQSRGKLVALALSSITDDVTTLSIHKNDFSSDMILQFQALSTMSSPVYLEPSDFFLLVSLLNNKVYNVI